MEHTNNNYTLLINKLDQFIRKYYMDQLLRGLIYASALLLALFLTVNILEYFLFLPTLGRKILFYGFLGATALVAYQLILLPLFHYLRLGKVISHEQAATIIGKHFGNVEDRLLNILQLKKQADSSDDKSLINASIDQKIETLNPVPFSAAINLGDNRKYLKYLVLPVLILVTLMLAWPDVIQQSSARLIRNNDSFERPAPFKFVLVNDKLSAMQYTDLEVLVDIEGEALPDEAYVVEGGDRYKLKKNKEGQYTYTFRNLQETKKLYFSAVGFNSKEYTLEVLPKPMVLSFKVALDYPAYTGRTDEVLENIGDLQIPEGTKAIWDFSTKSTSEIGIMLGDSMYYANRQGKDHFTFVKAFKQSTVYTLKVSGEGVQDADSITYSVQVSPDQYPSITMQQIEDSVAKSYIYFTGELSDDYGLSRLVFKYKSDAAKDKGYESTPIQFDRNGTTGSYNYYWDLKALGVNSGEGISYYFEIWDNDGVNGSKASRTPTLTLRTPTKKELDEQTDKNNDALKDKMADAMEQAKDIQQQVRDMKDKALDKKDLSWEDKKAIEELVKQQKELEKQVSDIQKDFKENLAMQENYKDLDPQLKEKQEKLQELFDQVMNDEMKELFEKLEQMVDNMDKEELLENMADMEMDNEQLEQELDRMLELFKKLEFEQKLTETIDEMNKLAEEQEKLAEQTENGEKSNEELADKQEELNEKMQDLEDKIADMEKMQEELSQQEMSFDETQEQMDQAQEQMEQGKQDVEKGQNKKASQKQKNAAQKMKDMASNMQQQMQQMQMEQMELDMAALRQLMENLLHLSFDQEKLMAQIKGTNINNPEYVKLVQQQKKLKDDTEMVEDSLYALAKRVVQIESFVTEKIKDINKNLGKSIELLEARNKFNAEVNQQLVMTGYNDLALMFSEVMDQMQQQMSQQMPGTSQCQKPGSSKPKPSMSMSQMQQQLNDQLKKMQESMKQGKKPGEGGKGGKSGMSKELAKAAAQQKALRQALQKLNEMENKDGNGSLGNLEELMKEMDKTETELVNKQLTEEMMKRQQEILTKLLDAEKAMKERETDNKRKSDTADEIVHKMPPSLEEYLKKREAEIQLYKTVPPSLRPYYKNLVESYFKNISF